MKTKYILDSNICIHLLRNRKDIIDAISRVGWDRCCISELTVVELYYGAECSNNPLQNRKEVESFIADIEVLPFNLCIKEFCRQKARLRTKGLLIEDFDLFIGSMSVATGYTLVTENVKHLSRIEGIRIENWVKRS